MRIGVTGHQTLGDGAAVAWVRAAVNQVLGEHIGALVGVSSLAIGADQLFASLAVQRGGVLEVVLPFPEYREHSRFGDAELRCYDRLVAEARVNVLVRDGRSDEEAYLRAGQDVVVRCDLLIAVWDGAPARGLGGTADIVAHARERGRATVVVDPVRRTITRTGDAAVPLTAGSLSDEDLEAARHIGDPLLDPIVFDHVSAHGPGSLGGLVAALFRTTSLPEHPLIRRCLDAIGERELGDPAVIARGQRLFALFGPEIFLILGSCSLPLAFAAGNGVQAIYRARRLKDEPVRRLYDTAQMVINVMQVGQLASGCVGWRATRKVRLIHALIRTLVQLDRALPWAGQWGTPINQEDLAGTLLSFSVAVLHGLRRMGARLAAEDADAYVYAWAAVGRLLGVDESLLASNETEALRVAERIGRRQIRATPEGTELAQQLMAAVATLFPLPGYANSLTHFFLRDTAFGENVATVLNLPAPDWTKALIAARAWQKRKVLRLLAIVPGARRRRSFLAQRFIQRMVRHRRPDGHAPFEIPETFARAWQVYRGDSSQETP